MIRATVDTSILAPSVRRQGHPESLLAPVIRLWRVSRYELVVSEHIIEGVRRTLSKPYFSRYLTPQDRAAAVEQFRRDATVIEITVPVVGVATQPGDDLILATA